MSLANPILDAARAASPDEGLAVEPWGSNVLLVEDDAKDADKVRDLLHVAATDQFYVTHVDSLTRAQASLARQDFSIILMDLSLPDARGLEGIEALVTSAPDVPLVVLSGVLEQRLAVQAVSAGAQDIVMKCRLNAQSLIQSLRYAIDRKRAEGRLARLAQFDQVTGLANRSLFQRRLDEALTRAELSDGRVALLYIDIDVVSKVTAERGFVAAEAVLHEVGERLRACVREAETVARLETDEFAVILEGVVQVEDAEAVAERIMLALAKPIGDIEDGIRASIGVALSAGASIEALVERADNARCKAKSVGPGRVALVQASEGEPLTEPKDRALLGLQRNEFTLVFQPRLDLDHDRVSAVEAFLRWDDPERGWLRPPEFMAALGRSDSMLTVTEWVVGRAAELAAQWRADGLAPVRVAINISEVQFCLPDAVARLVELVTQVGAEPSWFELDCAEKFLMANPAQSRSILKQMQAAGFHTSVDDFGTGFGYLSELARLPLDVLKIDRTIIDEVDALPARRALAAAAVGMGRELGLEVVAEGVERETQVRALREIGAATIQGYWIAEPKTAEAFANWWACRAASR